MSKPTWNDTEEIQDDIPSFEDTEAYDEPSQLESAARGAGQGLTMGFMDELLATLGTSGASPSQVVAEPQKAIETEKQMMKDYESNLQDERLRDQAAREANPYTYGTSEIVSGIVPGLVSGGGAAAANLGKNLTKEAVKDWSKVSLKEAAKNAAKLGAKYGAVSGAGYSEADDLEGLATDVAIGAGSGAALGAGLPVAGRGLKKAADTAGAGLKGIAKRLPSADTIADSFKYGKKGRALDEDVILEDIKKVGTELLDNIESDKSANNIKAVKEKLTKLGYKVNTKEAVEDAIRDIKNITEGSLLDVKNKDILPTLERLTGGSRQVSKMENSAEKSMLKRAIQKGDDVVEESIDLVDVQGRPVIKATESETGKVRASVGDIEKKLDADLENLTIDQVESLRSDLNVMTNLAGDKGSVKDPVISRTKSLASTLKELADAAVKEGGDTELITKRQRFSDIFSAEELLGIKKKLNPRSDVDKGLKIARIGEKLTQPTSFEGGEKVNMATNLLGEKVISPKMKEDIRLLKSLRSISKQSGTSEGLSISGLYKKVTGEGSNLLGRGVNQVSKVARPVTGAVESMSAMSKERLTSLGQKLIGSGNKGAEHFGTQLVELANKEGMARSQAMWALSQSPAFRKVLEKQIPEIEAQVNEDTKSLNFPEQGGMSVAPEESNQDYIEKGLDKILDLEAGYQNQQEDTGNFIDGQNIGTNRGITPQAYMDFYGVAPTVDEMKNLTKEQAVEIYNENYIKAPKFDTIADKELQLNMIDFGINSGTQTAVKALQELVGVSPDGFMGEETLAAVEQYSGDISEDLNQKRRELLRGSSKYDTYGKGWENRISSLENFQEENLEELEQDIDRVNQQQSSGDNIPVDQLESLLGKIDSLRVSQEKKDELENDAITMSGFSDGEILKQKIQMIKDNG